MQSVAAEMNLSETAFLVPRQDGFDLRWFTPITEVDLCGHATLASAHILWETERLPMNEPARFHTRSGMLTATRAGDWIEMDFPATPPEPIEPPPGLSDLLGSVPCYVGRTPFDLFVELTDEEELHELSPDFAALSELHVVTINPRTGSSLRAAKSGDNSCSSSSSVNSTNRSNGVRPT